MGAGTWWQQQVNRAYLGDVLAAIRGGKRKARVY